ncbi:MAG: hypothetical protein MZV64_35210 [Ignavibacteriales bacterium]|nr:hypothetical protein [Ignavibacteriales bacterium]
MHEQHRGRAVARAGRLRKAAALGRRPGQVDRGRDPARDDQIHLGRTAALGVPEPDQAEQVDGQGRDGERSHDGGSIGKSPRPALGSASCDRRLTLLAGIAAAPAHRVRDAPDRLPEREAAGVGPGGGAGGHAGVHRRGRGVPRERARAGGGQADRRGRGHRGRGRRRRGRRARQRRARRSRGRAAARPAGWCTASGTGAIPARSRSATSSAACPSAATT